MPSPILARADALMHRQRQNDGAPDEIPLLTDAFDGDDIPVLLDIDEALAEQEAAPSEPPAALPLDPVAPEIAAMPAAAETEAITPPPVAAIETEATDALLRELTERLQRRLVAELPRLIEATLRDYLAERAMLANLPPAQQD